MASDEGIPTERWSKSSLDRLIEKINAYGTTVRHPSSGRPKSVRTTDNIAIVVQESICSQDDGS